MEKSKSQISLWYIVITSIAVLLIHLWMSAAAVEYVAYSDFKVLVKAGHVRNLLIGDALISGTLNTTALQEFLPPPVAKPLQRSGRAEESFNTIRIADPSLLSDLDAAHVRYSGEPDHKWVGAVLSWTVPALILGAMWLLVGRNFGRAAGGMMEIGKSKARVTFSNRPVCRFPM